MDYTKLNELKSQYGDYEEVFNSGDYDKAADILMKVLDVIELEYEDKRKAGMLDNDLNVRKSEGTDKIWLCTNHIMEYYIYACYFEPQQEILMPELPIAEYYRTYADLCVKLQKYKRAEDAYKKALCWNPVDLDSYLGLAECYKYLNMMSRYLDVTKQAYRFCCTRATMARYYRNMGFYYLSSYNTDMAKACYTYSNIYYHTDNADSELNYIENALKEAKDKGVTKDDKEYVQNEVDQLVTEIDRVAETTKFNETYLLKGDDTKAPVTEGVFKKFDVSTLNSVISDTSKISESNDFDSITGKFTLKFTSGLAEGGTWAGKRIVAQNAGTDEITLDDAKDAELAALNAAITNSKQVTGTATNDGAAFDMTSTANMKQTYTHAAAIDISLHVGADSTANNRINLSIDSMSASGLHVTGLKVNGSDASNATAAINTIADAIQKVSTQRSALGAVQNRLEHTINNLDNVVENTTSAESQIRDTDMATEMVKYSNNNILAQAGQAMLAQSNQANQGVLSLLQ